jgi:hypothetical protein
MLELLDLAGGVLAFILTLCIFSYLLGDNPLYRIAVSVFVGAAAGYAVVIAYYSVIYPQMIAPTLGSLLSFNFAALIGPPLLAWVLTLLLVLKLGRGTSRLGSPATAFLVGVGSAVAVGGAVTGTLFPQTGATFLSLLPSGASGGIDLESAFGSAVVIVGTLAALGFFYYGGSARPGQPPLAPFGGQPADRPAFAKPIAVAGQIFIGTAFGVMYAGALAASIAFFAQSVAALTQFLQRFGF